MKKIIGILVSLFGAGLGVWAFNAPHQTKLVTTTPMIAVVLFGAGIIFAFFIK